MNLAQLLASMPAHDYGAVSLGQLIDTLEAADQDAVVSQGFGEPDSWRGVYAYLRFEPKSNVTVREMLAHAKSAVGSTYQGYKGGDFTMTRETPCFIDGYGECDDSAAITPERLAGMLGVGVAEHRPSGMPERPNILDVHQCIDGTWSVVIPDAQWDAFKAYVAELESIAARSLDAKG